MTMKENLVNKIKWENRTNFFLGLWVLLIPWTMADGFKVDAVNARMWNFIMIGLIVMVASRLAIKKLIPWAEWLSLFAGVWLITSPLFLLYTDSPLLLWNSLIIGVLITILSTMTIPTVEKHFKFRTLKNKENSDDHILVKH